MPHLQLVTGNAAPAASGRLPHVREHQVLQGDRGDRPRRVEDRLAGADQQRGLPVGMTGGDDLLPRGQRGRITARAGQQASAADLATLNLSVQAELASDYFSLRSQDTQQQLLDQTVEDYVRALELTQNLYNGGAAALTDVAQAQAQLETARTQAADIRLQRAQDRKSVV